MTEKVEIQQFNYELESNLFQCHIEVQGSGPNLLLLHGWASHGWAWRLLAPLLAKFFRVHNFDLPGFGSSKSNGRYKIDQLHTLLTRYMDQTSSNQWFVIGSSFGARLALELYQKFRNRMYPPILLSPPLDYRPSKLTIWLLRWLVLPILRSRVGLFVLRVFSPLVWYQGQSRVKLNLGPYLLPLAKNPDFKFAASEALHYLNQRIFDGPSSQLPAGLILWGAHDHVLSAKQAQRRLSSWQLRIQSEAGHHIMEDQPDWVFDQVLDFWRGQIK